ncbi:hypothetical protein Vafri_199 [Volvox africanus]|nr:hypothetical protein Vafri_199 [Volvox africanus]
MLCHIASMIPPPHTQGSRPNIVLNPPLQAILHNTLVNPILKPISHTHFTVATAGSGLASPYALKVTTRATASAGSGQRTPFVTPPAEPLELPSSSPSSASGAAAEVASKGCTTAGGGLGDWEVHLGGSIRTGLWSPSIHAAAKGLIMAPSSACASSRGDGRRAGADGACAL